MPFIGFFVTWVLSQIKNQNLKPITKTFSVWIMFLNVILSFYAFYTVSYLENCFSIELCTWINSGFLEITWSFYIDNLTVIMLLVVNTISFLVHLYSLDYMSHDANLARFMSYLSLFTFFMLILVTGDNFVILFMGWEGVGLCSYLLISFWFTRIQANKSAIKALIVNRISDFGLTIGIILIYSVFKTLDFATVFALAPFFLGKNFLFFGQQFDILSTIAGLLFFGACGKSAQIGLHTWLPDAMEGPTPVSALIHAATMVTAGVFLIIKCSPIFEYAPKILTIVTVVGALTAFFAATVGLVQNDIKKVIAYSTCSQLGYMIFACGISSYHVSLFHLVNHAFFKALLFLSAGAVIHSLSNEQDMRKYGGLFHLLPFTSIMLAVGSFSLMGIPFFSGFYSKDLILELAYVHYNLVGLFSYFLGTISAFFTSYYSYRVFYLTFICKSTSYKKTSENTHELPKKMTYSLSILAFGSIFFGYLAKDLFVGLGTTFWNQAIFILPQNNHQIEAEITPYMLKILPFFFSFFAIITYHYFCGYKLQKNESFFKKAHLFLTHKWYFDLIYNQKLNLTLFKWSYKIIFKILDKGLLELCGPQGITLLLLNLAINFKSDQSGKIYKYAGFLLFFLFLQIIIFKYFI